MKIGVLSDTHFDSLGQIPSPILKALSEVDLIVHAGDFTETAVLEGLRMLRSEEHSLNSSHEIPSRMPSSA